MEAFKKSYIITVVVVLAVLVTSNLYGNINASTVDIDSVSGKTVNDIFDGGYDVAIATHDIFTKRPWLDIMAYGANPADNGSSDANAIQAAVDDLDGNGGVVFFPIGTWNLDKTIRFKSSVKFVGQGLGSHITANLCSALFDSNDPSHFCQDVAFVDLYISNTVKSNSGGIGIDFTGVNRSRIENVRISFVETGVKILTADPNAAVAYYNTIYNTTIINTVTGIDIGDGGGVTNIFGGSIKGEPNSTVTTGIKVASSNIGIFGVCLENFTTGINVIAGSALICEPRLENDNVGGTGITITSGTSGSVIIAPYFSKLTTNLNDSGTKTICLSADEYSPYLSTKNLGVGTVSPQYSIDVRNGDVAVWNSGNNPSFYNGDDSQNYLLARYLSSNKVGKIQSYASNNASDLGINPEGGNVGVGTIGPTAKLDINGNMIRIRTSKTPASSTATGDVGSICWDSSYIYICVGTNSWKRVAISSW